jgi:uncharacterized protein YodC (DUF2158 family)
MPERQVPGLGLTAFWDAAQDGWNTGMDANLRLLSVLCQGRVISRVTALPGSPTNGQIYIVPSGGDANKIAVRDNGAWVYLIPAEGWMIYVNDENEFVKFDGAAWVIFGSGGTPTELQNMTYIGLGTTADSTNPLSVFLNSVLFNAKTAASGGDGDIRIKLNKETAGDTASFIFQDAFSGRAEFGLTGDDDFHFKVSPDGTVWSEALTINRTTGIVTLTAKSISNASLRDSTATSIIGRSAGTAGVPADIAASADGQFLQRSGGALSFAAASAGSIVNTPAGGIAATTVQAAINELDTEKFNAAGGTISGNVTVTGSLTLNGSTFVVNATQVTYDDIILVVGGDTAPVSDDAKDRGIEFRWHNGTAAKIGFFGFDRSTQRMVFIPDATDTADVISGTVGSFEGNLVGNADSATTATTVSNDAITNAKLANVATQTIKGRTTAATGDPEDLTGTQVTAMLDNFTTTLKGLVPLSGGGTTNFLRADGTWAVPPSGGSGEINTASNVNVGGVGVFKQKTGVNLEYRGINAASTKIGVALDAGNNEIDIDVNEANLTLANIGGSIDLGGAKASGVLAAARFPALTGDVTTVAGTLGSTVSNDAITNAKLANVATQTIKGRTTAATGDPEDLTPVQVKTMLAVTGADVANTPAGGIAATTVQAAINELDTEKFNVAGGTISGSMTVTGDLTVNGSTFVVNATQVTYDDIILVVGGDTAPVSDDAKDRGIEFRWHNGTAAKIGFFGFDRSTQEMMFVPDATDTADVISGTVGAIRANLNGNAVSSTTAAAWATGRTVTNTGDVTGASASFDGSANLSYALTIANDAVTNVKLANMLTATFKGRATAGTGDPEDLSTAQATALLNAFVASGAGALKGLVPTPPGTAGTAKFLREDSTWADLQNLALVGVNTTADATNKLAVASPSLLFTNTGAGVQVKVNKAATGDTASFLFQNNFSGRAEIGLTGDDDFHFKVSADGSAFFESLWISRATGLVTIKNGFVIDPQAADPTTPVNGQIWYNSTLGLFRKRENGTSSNLDTTSGGGLADGDKGDIIVSASGATWELDAQAHLGRICAHANNVFMN